MLFNATLPLEELRADLCRRVNAERDRRIQAGMEWDGHVYQIDPASIDRMRRSVERGAPNQRWRTAANEWVQMSLGDLVELHRAASDYADAIATCAMQKKDAVKSSDNPDPRIVKTGWTAPGNAGF